MPQAGKIPGTAAVVVTYNPPHGLAHRIQCILEQVERIVVFDNASDAPVLADEFIDNPRIHYIAHPSNIGIAAGLNFALDIISSWGCKYAVIFDHDSTPARDMVAQLFAAKESYSTPAEVGIVVPHIQYAHPDIRCRWPQSEGLGKWRFRFVYADEMTAAVPIDLGISSGMLLNMLHWKELRGFRDDLFIDLVDTEYCLHLRAHGHTVLAAPKAKLQHALGDVRAHKLLGLVTTYPTNHSALRHYYISRNRILLSRLYGHSFPNWLAYEWLGALKLVIKTLCFESNRFGKFSAMLKGSWAGLMQLASLKSETRRG